jgi:nitroreductase
MQDAKIATTDHAIDATLARRWSPYWYSTEAVAREDLLALFEAARWAPSAFNEQPWRFIVAASDDPEAHARLLSCLVEANQAWARRAPVLALGVAARSFTRNGKPNRSAEHDLGLASAALAYEAVRRGLQVHMMGGILPDRARELYGVPDGFDVITALAVGRPGDPGDADPSLAELVRRDATPRERRPLGEFLFGGDWGTPLS